MALLDFTSSHDSPEWERAVFFIVNLLIYGGLNLSGADTLAKKFWIEKKTRLMQLKNDVVAMFEERYNIMSQMAKQPQYREQLAALTTSDELLNFLLTNSYINDKINNEPVDQESSLFRNTSQYFFKPLSILSLSGYYWITEVGMNEFMQEEMGLPALASGAVAPFAAAFAVFVVYGALMSQVVGDVASAFRHLAHDHYRREIPVSQLFPYAITRQASTFLPILGLLILLGSFSFATSVNLQQRANQALFEFLDDHNMLLLNQKGMAVFSITSTVLVGIITVLFNNYCTPFVVNGVATAFNHEDRVQKNLDSVARFIEEYKKLSPSAAQETLSKLIFNMDIAIGAESREIDNRISQGADDPTTAQIVKSIYRREFANLEPDEIYNLLERKIRNIMERAPETGPQREGREQSDCCSCVARFFNQRNSRVYARLPQAVAAADEPALNDPLIDNEVQARIM